jgi:thiol-disulfide isomerase/thioredoxin
MNKLLLFFLFLISGTNFVSAQQKAQLVKFSELEKMITTNENDIFIINFWATWCGPCLAELPDFQRFYDKNTNKNVKLILVSFDFTTELEKVNKFIAKKNLKPPVYLINETDQNEFINRVSVDWQGTIPATWFVNNKNQKKVFVEKPINETEISQYLNQIN